MLNLFAILTIVPDVTSPVIISPTLPLFMLKPALAQTNVSVPLWEDILPNPCIEKSFNLESNSSPLIVSTLLFIPDIKPKYLPSFSLNSITSPSCWSVLHPLHLLTSLLSPHILYF